MQDAHIFEPAPAGEQKSGLLYPTMVIAAVAAIVFSIVGIAAMTGLVPSAVSKSDPRPAAAPAEGKRPGQTPARPAGETGRARTAVAAAAVSTGVCVDCGVVNSIRVLESAAAPGRLGTVAGGVLGGVLGNPAGRGSERNGTALVGAGTGAYPGNETENYASKAVTHEIRVRMDDGSFRTFFERSRPALDVGQKVRVADNRIVEG